MPFDYIIVGAGIAGITAAEELANVMDKKVLLIDKEDHVGGICYDFKDETGQLVHKHGLHVFHSNNSFVFNYLSLFTTWRKFNIKLLYRDYGTLIPVPFNFISIDKCLPSVSEEIKTSLLDNYEINSRIPIRELKDSGDKYLNMLGEYAYDRFCEYFKKLYDITDSEIEGFEDRMFPFRMSYDCRYYTSIYQGVPTYGYTEMFKNMLSNHNITVMLNKDYNEVLSIDYENYMVYYEGEEFKGHLIFTGMIDEFFDYRYGELEYNCILYDNEVVDKSKFQDNCVVIYSEDYHFTRINDYSYLSDDYSDATVAQFEYPVRYDRFDKQQNVPYYPVDLEENVKVYEKYKKLSEDYDNITFIGRLAEYKLYEMDEVVEQVLKLISEKFVDN